MAVLDFGKNKFTITVSGTTASNHAPVAGGLFRRQRGSAFVNPARDGPMEFIQGALSISPTTVHGTTRKATHAPGRPKLGMFGSGRVYESNYVYVSNFTPKVIFVM